MKRTVYNTRQDKQNTKRDCALVNLNLTSYYQQPQYNHFSPFSCSKIEIVQKNKLL